MHADALPLRMAPNDEGYGKSIAFAIGLHVLLALLLLLSSRFSWDHDTAPAAGLPVIDASLDASASEMRAAERALKFVPAPIPDPQPVDEVAPEDTVPPPQPIAEPTPQDSPTPQQQVAQERVPVPDTQDQDEASKLAVSQEKALQEQEQKRRQQQIDLTEQKRVEEAENKLRLAKQQEDADKQKKLDEIRRQRAQLTREAQLAEQKLRQLADARTRQSSVATPSANSSSSPPAGNNGVDPNLKGQYAAAIRAAVLAQWNRPDSVALGTRCKVIIRQLPGGTVMSAEVQPGCPMDQAGQDSVERAVLKAQPLPYKGFEDVFDRNLILNFEAQDR